MMDYISREVAFREICKSIRLTSVEQNTLYDTLRKITAADVAPVVHEHWIPWEGMFNVEVKIPNRDSLGMFCSGCKSHNDMPRNYCPECGAKMDEEAHDTCSQET